MFYHDPNRISYAQVYPFFHYADALFKRYGVEVRAEPFDAILDGTANAQITADIVILQPWFTIAPNDLTRAIEQITKQHTGASVSFLDSYAHNDLRLARYLPEDLAFYIKKSLFETPSDYLNTYRGDTQMMQYYADQYGIEADAPDFQTPPTIIDKLRLSPNFLTAPHFVFGFDQQPPPITGRPLDMQLRLGKKGGPIYAAMRNAALGAVDRIANLKTSPQGAMPYNAYMAEMRSAKLCFSPFGFGELCWRDIEAIQTGAVMIKPDMSHLQTLPDLYEPGVTYLPVKWDFSDLDDVVAHALANPVQCQTIAITAWNRAKQYLVSAQFVDDVSYLF